MNEVLIKNVFLTKEIKFKAIALIEHAIKTGRFNKATNLHMINLKDRLLTKANVINSYDRDLLNLLYRIDTAKKINKAFNKVQKIKREINIRDKKQGKLSFITNYLNNYISKVFSLLLLVIFSIVD